jgi:glycosyltransferase involved in cell wall biosynthesis
MKIICVNRFFFPDYSATSQLLTDLAFYLAELGHDIHVVTSRLRYEDPRSSLPSAELVNGVRIHRIWTSRFGRGNLLGRAMDYATFYLSSGWRLFRLTEREDIVVAKTDPPLISVIAALIASLRAARLVNWVQDVFPEAAVALGVRGLGGALGRMLLRLRNASLARAITNVVLSEDMATYLVELGTPRDRIRVVPNWVDDEAIVPIPSERNRLRELWGLSGKFVVGYSGNMGLAHEFETILEAMTRLRAETGIVFLLIGGGSQAAYLQRETVRRRLSQVQFKPYQPKEVLAESLGAADVHLVSLRPDVERFVVPSKFYGIAAAARPVVFVGDPDGEIGKTVRSANCGAVVRPKQSAELANVLLTLRDDKELRQEWGRNARRLIDERLSRKKTLDLWREILTSRQPAVPAVTGQ